MQTLYQSKPTSNKKSQAGNPFARALAETEKKSGVQPSGDNSAINEAIAKTGGKFPGENQFDQDELAKQQEEMRLQQKREAMRRKLHEQVNPIDTTDIFSAREQEVKKEIDQLRSELKLLAQDVAAFDKEVEITLMTNVAEPGFSGSYFINFFQQLRQFIMLLRQKIKSAKTWATQFQSKAGKRKKGHQPGLEIGGKMHEKASTIQDMMHHERSNAYGGA